VSVEVQKEIELEIAYVLFIDIVGYSKLVTHEQRRLLELLNRIVREAEHFRTAEANGRLITVPTGDGMALVFYNTPEAPVECALEIGRAAREHRELKLRMVMHGVRVSVANLYTEELGNPEVPQKFRQARKGAAPVVLEKKGRGWIIGAAVVLIAALIIGAVLLSRRSASPGTAATTASTIPDKSIAVLPFENLSRVPDHAY